MGDCFSQKYQGPCYQACFTVYDSCRSSQGRICLTFAVASLRRRPCYVVNHLCYKKKLLWYLSGEPEVSSTEVTAGEQPQPTPSTAVVSGKRQRDEPEATDRWDGFYWPTYRFSLCSRWGPRGSHNQESSSCWGVWLRPNLQPGRPEAVLSDLTPFSNPARLNLQVTEAHVSIGLGISETHFHCHHNMVTCSM